MRGPALALALLSVAAAGSKPAVEDAEYGLDQVERQAGNLIRQKGIDWKGVRKEILREAAAAKTDQDHFAVLVRLLARLRDGHAAVIPAESVTGLEWPGPPLEKGPGMFWCVAGKRILVKNSWGSAAGSGVEPGMEVVEVDGVPARKWLDARIAEVRETKSFSTDRHAEFWTCHWGLAGKAGSTMKVELRSPDGKRKKATLTRNSGTFVASGPVFPPEGLEQVGRDSYGRTAKGWAYIHLRKILTGLPAELDTMLAAVGDAPGLILDFRANGGGGTDHGAVVGRFVPKGERLAGTFESAGERPYTGPVVAIVDAGVVSAGETVSGYLKEYGRVYLIGESPTAGMSSKKTTVELPSKRFSLYFSVRSYGSECNEGRGIEGIGIEPHETLPYDPADLAAGVDTLIERAGELLAKPDWKEVKYRPPR